MVELNFLRRLFAGYPDDAGLTCEIRAFRTKDDMRREWFGLSEKHLGLAAELCAEMAPTCDVYVGVLPRRGRGGHQRNVTHARWLFCDLDAGDDGRAFELLMKSGVAMPPAMMVATTSGGAHLYWELARTMELDTPAKHDTYRDLLKRVVVAIGGKAPGAHADPNAAEEARILRVPGTLYHKADPPTRVRMAWFDKAEALHPLDWHKRLPLAPVVTPVQTAAFVGRGLARTGAALRKQREGRVGTLRRVNDLSSDVELVSAACKAKNGDAFTRLFAGDCSDYAGDESRADAALLAMLAWWTDGDAGRMEALFNESGLGQREKWRERPDYRKRTIDRVLAQAGAGKGV